MLHSCSSLGCAFSHSRDATPTRRSRSARGRLPPLPFSTTPDLLSMPCDHSHAIDSRRETNASTTEVEARACERQPCGGSRASERRASLEPVAEWRTAGSDGTLVSCSQPEGLAVGGRLRSGMAACCWRASVQRKILVGFSYGGQAGGRKSKSDGWRRICLPAGRQRACIPWPEASRSNLEWVKHEKKT